MKNYFEKTYTTVFHAARVSLTRAAWILVGLLLTFSLSGAFHLQVRAEENGGVVPGEILVIGESGVSDAEAFAEELSEKIEEKVSVNETEAVSDQVAGDGAGVLIRLEENADVKAAIRELNKQPDVEYVQPNFRYRMMDTFETNDNHRSKQYYLEEWNPEFTTMCGANVTGAWQVMGGYKQTPASEDPEAVTIAVLDSGCQVTHEDLADNVDIAHSYDAVKQVVGPESIADPSGHGTHVCGIAAGVTDNQTGIAGASGNYAKVLPINVFVGKWSSTKDMVKAFSYLEELMDSGQINQLHVINMSLGGYGETDEDDVALESYITRMREKDVLTVCAGGNGDDQYGIAYKDNPVFPGDFEACMCVTSLDSDGTNSSFSDYNMAKDISAPGSAIISTMIDGKGEYGTGSDDNYAYLSGTSMASPLVAGIAALLWADNNQLTADQVFEAITASAVPVNNAINSHEGETGSAGAIDAAKALIYAREHFDAVRSSVKAAQINLDQTSFTYDGTEKKPGVSVSLEGTVLKENADYIVSYRNTKEAGTAELTVTGIGSYIGSRTAEYKIQPADLADAEVTLDPAEYEYDGAYHFPTIKVMMHDTLLKWGRDYTPTALSNGKKAGEHKIRLDGKGNYTGQKLVSYLILGDEDSAEPTPAPSSEATTAKAPENTTSAKKVTTFRAGKGTYRIKPAGSKQVTLIKCTAKGNFNVPAKVKYKGISYQITGIGAGAFKNSKVTKLTLKTKKLKKKTVKGSLNGSKIKKIRISVGSKKNNKIYIRKYKKFFTKKNCGRKVKVN